MIIRKATAEDIPAIVQLLKASLGDVSSAKSEAYWNWKHVHNPFGPSPVLVAEENGSLIGVRAFMRWDWQQDGKIYRALRAVDTATHPAHQGKGIFKKLTLQLIEEASKEGFDFIFNSPNAQSTPGYLKMGWEVWGKVPVHIRPVLHFKSYKAHLFDTFHQQLMNTSLDTIPLKWVSTGTGMQTAFPEGFFSWRYQHCPVKPYGLDQSKKNNNQLWLFFTVKMQRWGAELRICHFAFSNSVQMKQLYLRSVELARNLGCRFISIAGIQHERSGEALRYGFVSAKKISLTLTIRHLSDLNLYRAVQSNPNWVLQNGDVELF